VRKLKRNIQKDLNRDNVSVTVRTANGIGTRPPQSVQDSPFNCPSIPNLLIPCEISRAITVNYRPINETYWTRRSNDLFITAYRD
jgi:hypothetical protein